MLDEYKKKRDFKVSPEPNGNNVLNEKDSITTDTKHINYNLKLKSKSHFVFQKHDVTRLHYDFRLESVKYNVLLSWAVPKGPSQDTSVRRLAIQTEDHPVDYLTFEGIIPEGNYGAGTVIVWDIGVYSLEEDNDDRDDDSAGSIEKDFHNTSKEIEDISDLLKKYGKITFTLHGQKIKGKFSLVKIKNKNQWLLIKLKDKYAINLSQDKPANKKEITESRPESILSGKTNQDLGQ